MTTNFDNTIRYSANITAGSLLLRESRKVTELLLQGLSNHEIKQVVVEQNLFQVRSQSSATRRCRLILDRLNSLDNHILPMIVGNDLNLVIQALLACSIKHSRLLGDFMLTFVGQKIRLIDDRITDRDWDKYIESCEDIDDHVKQFTESTKNKLRQVILRILIEAKFLESQKTRRLTPVRVEPELKSFLIRHEERYVLKCLEVCE
mgnify:CR=1 FL=1